MTKNYKLNLSITYWEGIIIRFGQILQSYGQAIDFSELIQRLPALVIALWLGIISMAMIPHYNVIEGGILFLLFLISCLLIDSAFNPRKIKNTEIAHALRTIGYKNYKILIIVHLAITIILAAHLSFIISKGQILLIVILGITINILNSRFISRSKSLAKVPNVTGVVGGVILPMIGVFFIVGNEFDLFSLSILFGIGFVYTGIEIYNQIKSDLEIAPGPKNNNSIEWEAISITELLDLPNSKVKEVGMQLYNIHNEKEFKSIPPEQCALFLPHCLRIAERCKANYNEEGLQCKHCSKNCKINQLLNLGEKLGYKCFVVPGGAMVFNIAKKYRPSGVVAVACMNELREGTARTESEYSVPFQIIPLRKDGCVNTDVCVDEVKNVMEGKFTYICKNN
jgi:hypothetical protein